nr:MAG TPA: hypothetical protein [Caudoviricetes sp.]
MIRSDHYYVASVPLSQCFILLGQTLGRRNLSQCPTSKKTGTALGQPRCIRLCPSVPVNPHAQARVCACA